MTLYMDYASPAAQFTYDLSANTVFRKDARNFIQELSRQQLNTLDNLSLLDIYLSTGNAVEPHIHQNAAELVYVIAGAAVVSLLNPFTKAFRHYPVRPGQVVNIPQGWWHYEFATEDGTHLLAIFNAPVPEIIYGSDILRLTPPDALARIYCLDEAKVKETLAPITGTTVIGPPAGCSAPAALAVAQAPMHAPMHAPVHAPAPGSAYAPAPAPAYGYAPAPAHANPYAARYPYPSAPGWFYPASRPEQSPGSGPGQPFVPF